MFYFMMQKAEKGGTVPRGFRQFQTGNFRALVKTGELFAFCHEEAPFLLVGESHFSPSIKDIGKLIALARQESGSITWDGCVDSLLYADLEKGTVKILKSGSLERPVYFCDTPDGLAVTSHVRLFPENGIRLTLDESRWPEFFVYRTITPPATLFSGIGYIPGGWVLSKDFSRDGYRLSCGWRPFPEKKRVSIEDAADEAFAILKSSVKSITDSDPKATVLLSGGLDSTILAGIANDLISGIKSVSSGFHAITGDNSESDYARSAAKALGTRHSVCDINGVDYLFSLVDSIYTTCEPIHHLQSAVLQRLFKVGIDSGSKFLICGEGADSLSCNSAHYDFWRWRSIYKLLDPAPVKAILSPALGLLARYKSPFAHFIPDHSDNTGNPRHFIWSLGAYGDSAWVRNYFQISLDDLLENRRSLLRAYADLQVMDKITMVSLLNEADETIKIWSLLAEGCGKLLSNPFTDPRFIKLSMSLEWELKAAEVKRLLREGARRQNIPESIISRPKRSFGFPVAAWAPEGALFQPLIDLIGDTFDSSMLRSLQTLNPSRAMILWGYVNLWIWKRLFEGDVSPELLKGEIAELMPSSKPNIGR